MPSRNSIKEYVDDSYYHLYARGVNRSDIFSSPKDYIVFMSLLKRYLSLKPAENNSGAPYPNLHSNVELLAFCLMPNHFHLFVYQRDATGIESLMRALMTSYSLYYNKKKKRTGHLFEGRYKAARLSSDAYLLHISRYIHLNPKQWQSYPYSSLPYYRGELTAEWIKPARILELFNSREQYLNFIADYAGYKADLDTIKHSLANS